MSSERRTMEPDDLFRLTFLQGGRFSPDGRHVAYTVSHVDIDAEKEYVTIWLLSLETGEARQMTGGKTKDTNPRWSPDGRHLAFISDRGEKSQIYLMPVDGGEAQPLTDLKQGVSGEPVWSPDGRKIAFTAGPDYGDDDPPDLTKKAYRVDRSVYRFDGIGYLDQAVQDIYVIDSTGGEPERLTNDRTSNGGLAWSPDGTQILYAASMQPDRFDLYYPRVCIVDMNGEARELITSEWGATNWPTWTPDGRKIVFIGRPFDGAIRGTKDDLWTYDVASGEFDNRTAGLAYHTGNGISADMPIMGLRTLNILITDDNRSVYVQVQQGGTVQIYRVALSGPEAWEAVVSGDRACFPLDRHDGQLLFAATSMNTPPDLFIADLDGQNERRVTALNDAYLAQIAMPESERLLFKGTDDVQVEGWVLKPVQGTAPYPTILYIHGGPHGAYGNAFHFDFQMLAGAGYAVLFVNHRASTGYGNAFATAIMGDWGVLDYGDLMAGVDYAVERGIADPDRLGCCGTSGGGNLSTWIVGHTDRFKAAIPQNPVTNWVSFYGTSDIGVWFSVEELGGHPHEIPDVYARCSPITYAHHCTTPTLMVQSEHDWRCPAEQSEQFYTVLKANGCIAEMLRQPGGFHGASIFGAIDLRRAHNEAMLDWFGRYVLDAESEKAAATAG